MEKKIGFIAISTLIIITTLFCIQLTFAQYWHSVKVNAYGTNFLENNLGGASLEFRVVEPPSGLEIPNTICGINIESGENCTVNLLPDQNVIVTFSNMAVDHLSIEEGPESGNYIISYEGEAGWLMVNGADIPEFPPILIVPLFMTATLLAIIYRRKRTT